MKPARYINIQHVMKDPNYCGYVSGADSEISKYEDAKEYLSRKFRPGSVIILLSDDGEVIEVFKTTQKEEV